MTSKLTQGDCLEIMKGLPDNSVDYTFTSPPYNRKRNDKYSNYDDHIQDYYTFNLDVINELLRITKKHVIYNIQTNYYNRQDVYKIIGTFCSKIVDIHIWEKTNPMPASGHSITNAVEYFIILGGASLKSNKTYTKNIISSSVNSKMPKNHKAVMKQEIADYFIKNFTQENDTILDCFMGVGTTGVSCKNLNRNFIGYELDPEYFKIAQARIKHTQYKK
jgi:site-specific DNA-methyltransferase (adenine-specific)